MASPAFPVHFYFSVMTQNLCLPLPLLLDIFGLLVSNLFAFFENDFLYNPVTGFLPHDSS